MMKSKKMVTAINKTTLAVAQAASTDPDRAVLNGVHFTKEYIEATNGRLLIRAKRETWDADELPTDLTGDSPDEVIVPTKAIKAGVKGIKKSSLPVLRNAYLLDDGIKSTDIGSVSSVSYKEIEGRYPNTSMVIPEEGPLNMALSLDILERIVKAAKLVGAFSVDFHFTDEMTPVTFKMKSDSEEMLMGIAMPLRVKKSSLTINNKPPKRKAPSAKV